MGCFTFSDVGKNDVLALTSMVGSQRRATRDMKIDALRDSELWGTGA